MTKKNKAAETDGQESPPVSVNGTAKAESPTAPLDPEIVKKLSAVRAHVRESFGKTVMAMMMLPRYRSQTLADLHHLVLDPLLRDRIAIAYPGDAQNDPMADISGLAIWASVSEEVDAAIREQIRAGVFPLRLKSEDWTSGDINWLIDVIAITVTGAKTPKLPQWPYLGRPLGGRAWLEQLEAKTGGSLAPKKRGRKPGFKFA